MYKYAYCHIYIHLYICIYTDMYSYMYTYTYTYHVSPYPPDNTHFNVGVCVCIYKCVCVYVNVCECAHVRGSLPSSSSRRCTHLSKKNSSWVPLQFPLFRSLSHFLATLNHTLLTHPRRPRVDPSARAYICGCTHTHTKARTHPHTPTKTHKPTARI